MDQHKYLKYKIKYLKLKRLRLEQYGGTILMILQNGIKSQIGQKLHHNPNIFNIMVMNKFHQN